MESSMLNRLQTAEKRLAEIDEELLDEKVTRDIKRFKELSKERSYLDKQVEAFHRYQKTVSNLEDAKNYLDGFDNAEVSIEECLKETTGSNYSLIELTLFELHNARNQPKDTSAEIVYDPSYPDYYNYVFNKLDKKLRKDAEKILKTSPLYLHYFSTRI